ncbi:MAG TPA: type VI secretion system protein IglI family protein [Myxococcaceae bacterium]
MLGASPLGPPEEERATPELDKVGELVARGAYAEAGQLAEKLLREGVRDVRIIGPWLFGTFLARDLPSIHTIFGTLQELLTQRWASFGPRAKKEVLADNGLRWLFKAICRHLEYHQSLQDKTWNGWREPRNRETLQQALDLSEPLLAALASTLPKGHSVPPFRQVISWMQAFLKTVASQPAPVSQPAVTAEQTREDSPETADSEPEPTAGEEPAATAPRSAASSVPASPALELLMRKLQAFNSLVREQDFVKASVVAADVLALIERFDPRVYLPALFAPFFSHLSTHAQELEPLLQSMESLSFRALNQLYQVDLDTFLLQSPMQGRGEEE